MDPATIVQQQLDAYNAHDVDALVAIYADDAEQFEHPAKLLARGSAQIRERFATRFREARPRAALIKRVTLGHCVIDHELVACTFPAGPGKIELLAIYEVQNLRIAKAWFVFGAETLDAKP